MFRMFSVLISFSIVLAGCYSAYQHGKVNKFKDGESWNFVYHDDQNQISLLSAATKNSSPDSWLSVPSFMYIHILCKYGVSSLSNDCITSFSFYNYPENYGTFPKHEPINMTLIFDSDTTQVKKEFTFFQFNTKSLMVSPDQVDTFLSLLTLHEGVTLELKWRRIQATYESDHVATFPFKFNRTGLALHRFKKMVITKNNTELEKSNLKPKRQAVEVMNDYI